MLGIYLSMLNSAADQEAFQALYERNKYKVFHAAQGIVKNKLWAEDVVHEAFLYVADHYEELSGKYTEGLDGYLYRCVQCRAVNLLRRRGREESYEAWMVCTGWSAAEIAEHLGLSPRTVQRRLERAWEMIREELSENDAAAPGRSL